MKKLICFVFTLSLFALSACSVQETVSPLIFINRVQKHDKNILFDVSNTFIENERHVFYTTYSGNSEIVFEISVNEQGDAEKINLACNQTDKIDSFVSCVQSVAETYAPDDDAKTVVSELFLSRELSDRCLYYDTQWHEYSAVLSEKGLFFSVESKKLVPRSDVEFSLKQNDIVTY